MAARRMCHDMTLCFSRLTSVFVAAATASCMWRCVRWRPTARATTATLRWTSCISTDCMIVHLQLWGAARGAVCDGGRWRGRTRDAARDAVRRHNPLHLLKRRSDCLKDGMLAAAVHIRVLHKAPAGTTSHSSWKQRNVRGSRTNAASSGLYATLLPPANVVNGTRPPRK